MTTGDPHAGQPVLRAGAPLHAARSAMVLLHGRGARADDILSLANLLPVAGMAYLAPQAAHGTWYPHRFIAPIDQNEPWLGSALRRIGALLAEIAAAGVTTERAVLLGFSQGGCLALEYAIRHPARYGSVVGLSAGLIGPPGTSWDGPGEMGGTPVFLGCSDVDAHIPAARVWESAAAFEARGAHVTAVLYPGMGHTVNEDEIAAVRRLIEPLAS